MSAAPDIRTTCPYCGVGCGLTAKVDKARVENRTAILKGDGEHPANYGRLCSKGTHVGETIGLEGRLLYPQVNGVRTSWDDALTHVADRFQETIQKHGPDSVAFYVSGQLLTEDYYVANKLMKGFIGSGNIDTNSRLCMASAVAGHVRAFGEDVVPGNYEDLDIADLVVLVGSNTAWCHPILFQRIAAGRETRGTKVVVIDPRRTETCEIADLHLAVAPGTDVALFNSLLAHLVRTDATDNEYLRRHVSVPPGYLEKLVGAYHLETIAETCGLAPADLQNFFELFAKTERTVTVFSQGVNQSTAGTDKVNAIINCHLATGRVGKRGASPFSVTGQPNAMGGREVGGLANQLAAHMRFENVDDIDRVARFWKAPSIARRPGLKAIDLFDGIAAGRIKAVWIMATNPAVSMPEVNRVRNALADCPFVVVSDCMANTDTLEFAHVALPAAAWGEKDGTVTNSERRISRQRSFLLAPGEARPDWWIVTEVARRMGFSGAFSYEAPDDIFREHARLSAFENQGGRCFDIGAYAEVSRAAYDAMEPFQWPASTRFEASSSGRLFADCSFKTTDGRANIIDVSPRAPAISTDPTYPMILNTGRMRDQWHTMTRTALSPRLNAHAPEPCVQVHPNDAVDLNLQDGGLVTLTTAFGKETFRLRVSDGQRRGEVFCPIHWNRQFSSAGRVGRLINDARDPLSGQPEFKHTPVRIETCTPRWGGFLITTGEPELGRLTYWTRVPGPNAVLYEIAGDVDASSIADNLLVLPNEGTCIEALDPVRGTFRRAVVLRDRIQACLFISEEGSLPSREWLLQQFSLAPDIEAASGAALLAGRQAGLQFDAGPQICACFNVGLNVLLTAIRDGGLISVSQVGDAVQAGTNCGSCKPKIQSLLRAEAEAA